jgi:hypothetical protein
MDRDELVDGRQQLPDSLRNEAELVLKRVGAYISSNGNPDIMNSIKDPPTFMGLLGLTFVLGLAALIISEISMYTEIKRNWPLYQCNPSITPFAAFYGHNLQETMNFCISKAVKAHAGGVIDPIFKGIDEVSGVVDGVFEKIVSVEAGVAGLLNGFESFVVNFVNSFRLVGVRVRMMVISIKEIFGRVFGLFTAFAYAAISAITFGENLICNPLVTFIADIAGVDICCFSPDTQVLMRDGSSKAIRDVQLGEHLLGGSTVTSTYLFYGSQTKMVRINGVHVSGNHCLRGPGGRMVKAEDHPLAIPAISIPRLWCLGSSNNQLPILSPVGIPLEFTDYEESEEADVVTEAQAAAERALNAGGVCGPPVLDYSLGLDPTSSTMMADSSWKQLDAIRVEDRLINGGFVVGVIREVCELVCKTPGGARVAAAQLVLHKGVWTRAAHLWPPVEEESLILVHIMVSNNASFAIRTDTDEQFVVRDYAEYSGPETQAPYDAAVLKESLRDSC